MRPLATWCLALCTSSLIACARGPVRHAETFMKQDYRFAGERALTLVGNTDELNLLQVPLLEEGFRIVRAGDRVLPDELARVGQATRYVLGVAGICRVKRLLYFSDYGVRPQEMKVEAYDIGTGERLFSGRVTDDSDCGRGFYAEVADAIERNWEPEAFPQ